MTLKQAIHVIMGANVGTTVTAWLLSLAGLDGSSLFMQLLKPSSFTPVLALIGIILIMAGKERQKDTGSILPVSYTHLDVYKRQGVHTVGPTKDKIPAAVR